MQKDKEQTINYFYFKFILRNVGDDVFVEYKKYFKIFWLQTSVAWSELKVASGEFFGLLGANGAGKSSFGRDLLERYAGQAKRISGIHALFISDDESKLSASNEFARLQSMIKERLFMPRISEYEKLILQLQSEEFEAAVNFKEACKTNNEVDPPITKIDRYYTSDLGKDVSA